MPDAFFYPEHWNAIFNARQPKRSWWEALTSGRQNG